MAPFSIPLEEDFRFPESRDPPSAPRSSQSDIDSMLFVIHVRASLIFRSALLPRSAAQLGYRLADRSPPSAFRLRRRIWLRCLVQRGIEI